MDDLLIVRYSDGTRGRLPRRAAHAPAGASLGIAVGAAFGLLLGQKLGLNPAVGVVLGVAAGIALGTAFGRLIAPRHRKPRIGWPKRRYDGMPFATEQGDAEDDSPAPNAAQ